ncbi:MAG: flagellar brake protein [Rubrivivax sp.]|nr:flagellar brake protein [Rubrivivax sp.]
MTAPPLLLAEIEDAFTAPGWRVSRPDDEGALHAEVLRELCDRGLPLHLGAAGTRGIAATLLLVDGLQEQIVLASREDGIAVARALQARPLWAAALLQGLRVQFALAAATAREGSGGARHERFVIQARWPREIHRTSRRREARVAAAGAVLGMGGERRGPVLRLMHGNLLASTRNLAVLDLSEHGCAVTLPAGMVPPAVGSVLEQVELELDEAHIVVADAAVLHVAALGRSAHRMGCRWQALPAAGRRVLRRWLAEAARPLPVGEASEAAQGGAKRRKAAQGGARPGRREAVP